MIDGYSKDAHSDKIYVTNGCSNHSKANRESNDYYATPPAALEKLLDVYAIDFELPKKFWKLCADWTRNDFLVYIAFQKAATREVDAGRECLYLGFQPVVFFTIQAVRLELLVMTTRGRICPLTELCPLTDEEIRTSISNIAGTTDGVDVVFPAMFISAEEFIRMGGGIDPDEYKGMTEEKKKERSIIQWMLFD